MNNVFIHVYPLCCFLLEPSFLAVLDPFPCSQKSGPQLYLGERNDKLNYVKTLAHALTCISCFESWVPKITNAKALKDQHLLQLLRLQLLQLPGFQDIKRTQIVG